MKKMKLGYSLPEIKVYFKNLFENKSLESDDKFFVPLSTGHKHLEVYNVPIDLPRYRLSNTRTIDKQLQYISKNGLPENYFENEALSDNLQKIQHGFLKELISRKNLKDYFKNTNNIQTTPLIITNDGFVISGNRRLCAFRELYYSLEEGNPKYSHFSKVRVVILPTLSEEDIDYIEDYFEQQPEIRDEFTWINKALGFEKRLKNRNLTVDQLANKTNVKKSTINDLLQKLYLSKEYLEFIHKPNEFQEVERDEYAFRELLKARKKFESNPAKKDSFQKLSFIALKNQSDLGDRMYKNIPIIQEIYDDIESEIITELGEQIHDNNSDDIDIFSGIDDDFEYDLEISQIIDNESLEREIFEIIEDKIQEYHYLKEEKNRKKAVLKKIQKANKELAEAFNLLDSETEVGGILEQLQSIEHITDKIQKWIRK